MSSMENEPGGNLRNALAGRHARIETSRGSVEYKRMGQGPSLLCLHGGMGGHDQSLLLGRALARKAYQFDVIAVSRPGYLGTPLSSGRTPEAQADLMAALLDRLGVERTLVSAVSAGGPAAVQFAIRHPERTRGLVLVSTCTGRLEVPPEIGRRLPAMRMMARLPWLPAFFRWRTARHPEQVARRAIADEALAKRTLAHPEAGPLLRALQVSPFSQMSTRLDGTLNDMEHFSTMEGMPFARLAVPTLVIHGSGDRVVPFAHALEVADGAPNAELLVIEGGEHVALFTHIDLVRERFDAFTGRLSRSSA